jgi:hypothetical protein
VLSANNIKGSPLPAVVAVGAGGLGPPEGEGGPMCYYVIINYKLDHKIIYFSNSKVKSYI